MKQATYFIEQVYDVNKDRTVNLTMQPISKLNYSKRLSEKFGLPTIAIFKVYPK